jgi:hypothetical protein
MNYTTAPRPRVHRVGSHMRGVIFIGRRFDDTLQLIVWGLAALIVAGAVAIVTYCVGAA